MLDALAGVLEAQADAHAGRRRRRAAARSSGSTAPSTRSRSTICSALDVNAGDYLPLDTKSANFDNIADAQLLSPTLMQAYLTAAAEISRLAVGDPRATAREATYPVSRWTSQREQVEGAPYGTRGGLPVMHTFPADGEYRFRVSFYHETTGALYGNGRAALHTAEAPEQVEISIDGERVALLDVDRWMNTSDPDGVNLRTEPIAITAGPHRVSAAFIRRFEGPVQDLISPLEWSIASTSIADAYGFTTLPHLRDMAITGPFDDHRRLRDAEPRGRSSPASRRRRPQQTACAHEIVTALASQAFRRTGDRARCQRADVALREGRRRGRLRGRACAWRSKASSRARASCSASRSARRRRAPARRIALSDVDLASRLSFFLWATGAGRGAAARWPRPAGCRDPASSSARSRRMLADRRSDVLASRFAAQWLRLQDLDKINPDVRFYPDFDEQLKASMRRETEAFFRHIVRAGSPGARAVLRRLHVRRRTAGPALRHPERHRHRVPQGTYPDSRRRGLLGHGSILTLTSHADRTSPVLRGKWVMEVLLGTPPPPPPPNVPDLDATPEADDGRLRTVRERMEQHRANPACTSCHRMIDPIGLALENFDVTGAWRIKDNGAPVDPASTLYDGTPLASPADLQQALLKRSGVLVRTFTENLDDLRAGPAARRRRHADGARHRATGGRGRLPVVGVRDRDRHDRRRSDEERGRAGGHARWPVRSRRPAEHEVGEHEMSFITGKHMPRRTMLRGLGATVALPFLDAMVPARGLWPAAATAASLDRTRLVCIEMVHGAAGSSPWGATQHLWSPAAAGRRLRSRAELAQPARAASAST